MNYPDSLTQRLSPQSLEAEVAALGEMLMDNSIIPSAKELIPTDFFYRESHRKIFSAILATYERDGMVDLVTINEELKKKGQLEEVGGVTYISDLLNCATSTIMLEHHAGIIREKAVRRLLIQRALEITTLAYGDADLESLLARYQSSLLEVLGKSAAKGIDGKLKVTPDELKNYFSFCRETPFEGLNRAIGGCFGGELIIIGGRPGMGKTALVLEFLKKTAISEGRPVIYFGAEMAKPVIYARLLTSMCKIPYNDLKKGKLNEEQAKKLSAAHVRIDQAPIFSFIIKEKISAISLTAQAKSLTNRIKEDIGMIAIENLQQIFWPDKKFKNRKEEVDVILETIRSFGLEMKVPILLSCQINREPDEREDKRPLPSDLKETGQVEEIADKILLLFRPNYYEKKAIHGAETGELIVAKGGVPMTLPLKFFGEYLAWEE